jgi:hypothetical protein
MRSLRTRTEPALESNGGRVQIGSEAIRHARPIIMKIRIFGAALLALCAFAVRRIHLLVHVPHAHPPTPAELVLSLLAILTGFAGAALLAVGPALFRAYAWPLPDAD